MPFMVGTAPVRRTLKYLEAGKIVFRDTVKIFTVHFKENEENHKGAGEFTFWHLDQIQYKNPKVQCLTVKNLTPTPFIRIFFENTEDVLINLDCRDRVAILDHLVKFTAVCKTESEIFSKKKFALEDNKSLFGHGCDRHCACEILGQVPCTRIVGVPYVWRKRGKFPWKNFIVPYCYAEVGTNKVKEE